VIINFIYLQSEIADYNYSQRKTQNAKRKTANGKRQTANGNLTSEI